MKIGRYILIAIVAAIALIASLGFFLRRNPKPPASPNQVELPVYKDSAYNTRAPAGTRIKVEVLNATTRRGLARRATQYLRDRGFDVVLMGNSSEKHEETIVLNRSNRKEFAELVAKAMRGRVESRPDTSRYLDVTVLVGNDWTPPAEPFYP
jgi:hypothetical protein